MRYINALKEKERMRDKLRFDLTFIIICDDKDERRRLSYDTNKPQTKSFEVK